MTGISHCREELSKLLSLDLRRDAVSRWDLHHLRAVHLFTESLRSATGINQQAAGGRVEGTRISGSDMDTIHQYADWIALHEHDTFDELQHVHAPHLLLRSCNSPGFCWLEIVGKDEEALSKVKMFSIPIMNKIYLSSELFTTLLVRNLPEESGMHVRVNGPALSLQGGTPEPLDWVPGIKCVSWPREANEWVSRSREHDWPDASLVKSYNKYPCYVIPSGKPSSKTSALFWRYAFVGMERELVWSFNDTQIQSLILLKMINEAYLKPIQTDQINSFAFKQIIFWDSEKYGLSSWSHSKLLDCVGRCLRTLQCCIQCRTLSHYIVRERNILEHKLSHVKLRMQFIKKIDELCSDIGFHILNCGVTPINYTAAITFTKLPEGQRRYAWKDRNPTLKLYKLLLSTESWEWTRLHHINEFFSPFHSILSITPPFVHFVLDKLQEMDKNPEYVKSAKDTVRVLYSTRLAYVCLAYPELSNDLAKKCFVNCCKDFAVSNKLHSANFHYVCCEKKECFKIVTDFYSKWTTTQYAGGTEDIDALRSGMLKVNNDMTRELLREDDPDYDKFTIDLKFIVDCDMSGLPEALQFMWTYGHLKNIRVFGCHPLVYAHYLLFQLYRDTQNERGQRIALRRLRRKVSSLPFRCAPFVESFLLGFCLLKMREFHEAGKWFIRSLMIDWNDYNVAYYFLCISFLACRDF